MLVLSQVGSQLLVKALSNGKCQQGRNLCIIAGAERLQCASSEAIDVEQAQDAMQQKNGTRQAVYPQHMRSGS